MHTEHTRLHVGAFFLTHWTKSRSRVTSSTEKAPGTISVSICVRLKVRTDFRDQRHAVGSLHGAAAH